MDKNKEYQHADDFAVDLFAEKMKSKLRAARVLKNRGGWEQCTQEQLSEMLINHISKGDPVDVANFCMFLSFKELGILSDSALQSKYDRVVKGLEEIRIYPDEYWPESAYKKDVMSKDICEFIEKKTREILKEVEK